MPCNISHMVSPVGIIQHTLQFYTVQCRIIGITEGNLIVCNGVLKNSTSLPISPSLYIVEKRKLLLQHENYQQAAIDRFVIVITSVRAGISKSEYPQLYTDLWSILVMRSHKNKVILSFYTTKSWGTAFKWLFFKEVLHFYNH